MLKLSVPTEGLTPGQDLLAQYMKAIFEKTEPECIGDASHFVGHVINAFQLDLSLVLQACLSHDDTPTH